jgi:cobalt-zinc-cadmium efflux system outer membrane protein
LNTIAVRSTFPAAATGSTLRRARAIVATAALALALSASCAMATATPLDLRTTLRLARDAELRSALDSAAVAVVEAEQRSARVWPNPVVSYGQLRPGRASTMFDGSRQQDVAVELPLLLGGKRAARIDAASSALDAALARKAVARLERASEAGLAFVALQAAQARRAAVVDAESTLTKLSGRLRLTDSPAQAYRNFRLDFESADWRAELSAADAELAAAQQRLADMLDIDDWRSVVVEPLQPLAAPADSRAPAEHLTIRAARLDESAAQAAIRSARAERFPQVSVALVRSWTNDPHGTADGVGMSIELPIFDSRSGAVDRASALAAGARLRRQLLEVETDTDIRSQQTEVDLRLAALGSFDAEVAPRLAALSQLAGDAYAEAHTSLADVLDAVRTQQRARLRRIELEAGLVRAQLRLLVARGELSRLAD